MKRRLGTIVLLLSAACIVSGCQKKQRPASPPATGPAAQVAALAPQAPVRSAATRPAADENPRLLEAKQALAHRVELVKQDTRDDLLRMRRDIAEQGAQAQERWQQLRRQIEKQMDQLDQQVLRLRPVAVEQWDQARRDIEGAIDQLQDTRRAALRWVESQRGAAQAPPNR